MIKWIATDLDGTLLGHFMETGVYADPNTIKTLNRILTTNKYQFTIATGRHYLNVLNIIKDFDIHMGANDFVVGMNGAQIYSLKEKRLVHNVTMSQADIAHFDQLCAYLVEQHKDKWVIMGYEDQPDAPMFYLDNHSEIFVQTMKELDKFEDANGAINKKIIQNFSEIKDVYKIIVNYRCKFDYEKEIIAFKKIMPNMNFAKSSDWFIEIFPSTVDKQHALKLIQKQYYPSIRFEELLIFGDSFNDWGMLKLVKNAVTRKSADPKIQAICKYVIDSPASTFVGDALELLIGK